MIFGQLRRNKVQLKSEFLIIGKAKQYKQQQKNKEKQIKQQQQRKTKKQFVLCLKLVCSSTFGKLVCIMNEEFIKTERTFLLIFLINEQSF